MKLLLIGGTRFSGRALTGLALERGHDVTVFHRGTGDEDPLPEAEHVHADRADGFGALAGRSFDAVADMCGYVPRELQASCSAFAGAGLYAFVSSLSVHRDDVRPDAIENDDVYLPPFPDTDEIREDTYGPLKSASEGEVRGAFAERALIVRPGLIVGPNDPTDRFTYWVRRVAAGGEVLTPAPPEYPVQWIDARDLAAFLLSLCERGVGGTYSVVRPPVPIEELMTTCQEASGSDASFTWVPKSFLDQHGVEPWSDLPLWIPSSPVSTGSTPRGRWPPALRPDRSRARSGTRSPGTVSASRSGRRGPGLRRPGKPSSWPPGTLRADLPHIRHLAYVEGWLPHLDSLFRRNHDVPTMRWPARFRTDESGFTLVELVISMAIVGLLIGAIGSALFAVLRTTDLTNKRMSESHDVQITSAYVANDVQGAKTIVKDPSTTTCAVTGSLTTLVTFNIYDATDPTGNTTVPAVYKCGTAANGETRVTRTFAGGTPIVIAHFAGTSRPSVTVTYDLSHPTIPVSVTMTFTKASDCTLDCTYTLFGSRRSFSTSTAGGTGSPPAGVVLMSTGTSSPLWVQGSCPNGGTDPSTACYSDPLTIGLPTSDLSTTGWAPTPSSPTTLYDKLKDLLDVTGISTITQNRIAQFTLSPVTAPGGMNPTVEIRAASAGAAAKLKVHIYDSSTMQELVASGNINVNSSLDNSGDWTLSNLERSQIPDTAYQHLALGIEMTNNKSVTVYGLALNTSGPGLLTIKGPLLVNSPNVGAVTLTGSKNATKLSIINGGDFEIYKQGTCVGCDNKTVVCASCSWNGPTPPWTNYPNSIPDPLLSLPAPTLPQDQTCPGSVCQPGAYASFSRTSNTQLTPGTYYMKNGMSITGSASLTCPSCTGGQGVLLYIAGGSVTFAGSSSLNLPASNSGLYKNILMFQAHGLTSPLKIAGNSGSGTTNVLGGIVYVPDSSQVTLATGSASLTAKAIVAQNIKVSSSVTIG